MYLLIISCLFYANQSIQNNNFRIFVFYRSSQDDLPHDIQTTVELAIEECIKKGILAEFLSKHRSEAIATSIFEYEEEKEMELIREDERRVGFTEGFTEGEASGFTKGEALNCIKVIKKMYSRSTPCDLAELLELSEEVVLEVIAALEADPHQDVQELVKIILV